MTTISAANNNVSLTEFIRELRPLVKKLRDVWEAHPNISGQRYHPLDRPGLYSTMDNSQGLKNLDIRVPGLPSLSLDASAGLHLCTHVTTSWGGHTANLTILGLGDHDRADNWQTDFAHAKEALEKTLTAVETGVSLDGVTPWSKALKTHLENEHVKSHSTVHWAHWIKTWGEPGMQASMDIACSLVDRDKNFEEWKGVVIASWDNLARNESANFSAEAPMLFG